ncbi:MAG: hypothetical protein ACI4TX_02650, partial [Christensenellales bacterium]
MLFTKKEIKNNIPILQDYIERRDKQEKEALEKAKNSEVEHENYDFKAVGLNASLLLERAMRECETYINNKKRLLYKITQKNQELQDYKNNYENLNKEHLKQQQISKENLERLRQSAETSTNRVEAGRIAKQQEEELKRQEQLEKDAQLAYDKYLKQKDIIDAEVKELEAELEEKKRYIEDVVMAEFKTYSARIYDDVNERNETKYNAIIEEMKEDNEILTDEIKSKILLLEQNGIDSKPTLKYEAKLEKDKAKEMARQVAEQEANEARLAEAMKLKESADKEELGKLESENVGEASVSENEVAIENQNVKQEQNENADNTFNADADDVEEVEEVLQFDDNDNDNDNDEFLQLFDDVESGSAEDNQVSVESNNENVSEEKQKVEESKPIDEEKLKNDLKNQIADEINQEKIKEDLRKQLKDELKNEIKGELEKENKYDEYGGYYDGKGNYIYKDGSYYDAQGNYYDSTGKLLVPANTNGNNANANNQIDAYGGYYDAYGNYIYEDGSYYDAQGNYYDAQGNLVDLSNNNENQGYYDKDGNYVYSDGSYYDAQGNYYDAQGNLVENTEAENMYNEETNRIDSLKDGYNANSDDAGDDNSNK